MNSPSTRMEEHDWEYVDGNHYDIPTGRHYELWSKHRCKKCGTKKNVVGGIASYEPKGKLVQTVDHIFGEEPPPCSK